MLTLIKGQGHRDKKKNTQKKNVYVLFVTRLGANTNLQNSTLC